MDEHDPQVVHLLLLGLAAAPAAPPRRADRPTATLPGSLATSSDWATTRSAAAVDRRHLVADRGHRALREGDDPRRLDLDLAPARRAPAHLAAQLARAQVERARVGEQLAVADVERLVVDQQPDQLAVGRVDDRLAVLRVAVAGLGVGQRPRLVEAVEVGAGEPERLALVEVAAQADVAVGEREHRLGLRQDVEVQRVLASPTTARRVKAGCVITAAARTGRRRRRRRRGRAGRRGGRRG